LGTIITSHGEEDIEEVAQERKKVKF
jgi:hypothetical protein